MESGTLVPAGIDCVPTCYAVKNSINICN